jgi:hypothetical protein
MKNLLYTFLLLCFGCSNYSQKQEKINGISFVASNREILEESVLPVIKSNANWVTLMPFGFMRSISDSNLIFNSKRQWINERQEGLEKSVALFHQKNSKIMIKPQVWIPNGFTGEIAMNTEEDWLLLEKKYSEFILFYAKIAQQTNCELFCIGTELNSFVASRPQFWNTLILDVKKIYTGKITYAENWDKVENVNFWMNLDFIGVDAYFPVSDLQTPTVKECKKGWEKWFSVLKNLSKRNNKKILFTEFGYQSRDFTAKEPWSHSTNESVNLKAQENALKALFDVFWKENWFAGGFLWKWFDNHEKSGGKDNSDYTIQNKPSYELVQKVFDNEREK